MKITQIPQLLGTVLRKLTLEDCPLGYCPHPTLILIQTLILTQGRTCWERGNLLGGNFLVTVGYVYIYDIHARDGKPKNQCPDENERRYTFE